MGPIGVLSLVPGGLGCHVTFHHWIISMSFLSVINFSVIQTQTQRYTDTHSE
jgi:hypothetical protein